MVVLAACNSTSASRPPSTLSSVPIAIPHTLAGRAQCDVCHASGISGIPIWPADHFGRRNDLCTECHKAEGEIRATATPGLVAVEISHTLLGRDDCLVCHAEGLASAPSLMSVPTPVASGNSASNVTSSAPERKRQTLARWLFPEPAGPTTADVQEQPGDVRFVVDRLLAEIGRAHV